MKSQFDKDVLVLTTTCPMTDGIDIDGIDIPLERMRLVNGAIVDAQDYDVFFIDENSVKHLVFNENWQELKCKFSDSLTKASGAWVVYNLAISEQYAAIDAHILKKIKEFADFDSIADVTICLNSSLDRWVIEAQMARKWVDQCYLVQSEILAGKVKNSIEDAIAALPPLETGL